MVYHIINSRQVKLPNYSLYYKSMCEHMNHFKKGWDTKRKILPIMKVTVIFCKNKSRTQFSELLTQWIGGFIQDDISKPGLLSRNWIYQRKVIGVINIPEMWDHLLWQSTGAANTDKKFFNYTVLLQHHYRLKKRKKIMHLEDLKNASFLWGYTGILS